MFPQDRIGKHVRIADCGLVKHALRGKTGVVVGLTKDGITEADYFQIDLDTIPENDEFFGSRVYVVVDVEDVSEIGEEMQQEFPICTPAPRPECWKSLGIVSSTAE